MIYCGRKASQVLKLPAVGAGVGHIKMGPVPSQNLLEEGSNLDFSSHLVTTGVA